METSGLMQQTNRKTTNQSTNFGTPVQASPEEQQLYEKIVGNAMNLIYDEGNLPVIVETLKGDGDPKSGLAMAAVQTIARVSQSAEQAGVVLHGDVLFHAGKEILEDLAELSARANIKDYSKDQDALDGAFFLTLDQFQTLMTDNGRIDQGLFQGDMNKLLEMDRSGGFEAALRQMAAADDAESGFHAQTNSNEVAAPTGLGGLTR